jgi:Flp pilus assembly protein TadG
MPVMMGLAAVALDGGILFVQRRQAQSIADSAALAGAYSLYNGNSFSTAQNAAIAVGAQNGVTIASSQVTQPKSGYVSVTVSVTNSRMFSAIWGAGTMSGTASATARGWGGTVRYGVLLLGPGGLDLSAKGNASLTVTGGSLANSTGSVVVDSNSSKAVSTSGNGTLTAPAFYITGGYTGDVVGWIATGVSPTPNPLASLSPPTPSSLAMQSYSGQSTLQPGVYTGGISLSSNANVTLSPGIYYLKGGGLSLTGNASLTGSGVMIYNDSSGGTISLAGNGSVHLSPMTTGPYAGITLYQAPSNTNDVTITGNGNFSITGTIYTAGATVKLAGNGDTIGSQIVADDMAMSGNGAVTVNYGSSQPLGIGFGLVK